MFPKSDSILTSIFIIKVKNICFIPFVIWFGFNFVHLKIKIQRGDFSAGSGTDLRRLAAGAWRARSWKMGDLGFDWQSLVSRHAAIWGCCNTTESFLTLNRTMMAPQKLLKNNSGVNRFSLLLTPWERPP